MATDGPMDDLVHGLQRAAVEPRLWPPTLARLARRVGVRALVLHFDARVAPREPRMAAAHGIEREFLESYGARFRHLDPGWSFLESTLAPDVLVPVPLAFRTRGARAFRAEWLEPQRFRADATLALPLARDGDALALCTMYREHRSPLSDAELGRSFRRLAPALRQAASITRALAAAGVSLADPARLLAGATVPMAVFDSLTLLVGVNEPLREFCDGASSLRIEGGRLVAVGPAAAVLQDSLTQAARPLRPAPSWVALPRADRQPDDRALVCPLPGALEGIEGIGFARGLLMIASAHPQTTGVIAIGDCELDRDAFELRRGGQVVDLQPLTLELLLYLASRAGSLVTHGELIENVWRGTHVSYWAVARAIREARRALGDDGESQRCIETVYGRGYRLRRSCTTADLRLILS